MKYNYRLASMIEYSRGKEFFNHVQWLFRLEIIRSVKLNMTYICPHCKGAGEIKYKDLDEFCCRDWVPWKTELCRCIKNNVDVKEH